MSPPETPPETSPTPAPAPALAPTPAPEPWLFIFDLDGTLTDHARNFAQSIRVAFEARDISYAPEIPDRLVRAVQRRVAGKESTVAYFKAFNHACKHVAGIRGLWRRIRFILQFSKIFHARLSRVEMFPGVVPVLRDLVARGHRLAILTSGSRRETTNTLSRHWETLAPLVDLLVTRDDVPAVKPDPAGIRHVMTTVGIPPGRTVMVGDTWQDVAAARNAGVRVVALSCGYGVAADFADPAPDFLLESVADLPAHVDALLDGAPEGRKKSRA